MKKRQYDDENSSDATTTKKQYDSKALEENSKPQDQYFEKQSCRGGFTLVY
jgi:hypothetical protein